MAWVTKLTIGSNTYTLSDNYSDLSIDLGKNSVPSASIAIYPQTDGYYDVVIGDTVTLQVLEGLTDGDMVTMFRGRCCGISETSAQRHSKTLTFEGMEAGISTTVTTTYDQLLAKGTLMSDGTVEITMKNYLDIVLGSGNWDTPDGTAASCTVYVSPSANTPVKDAVTSVCEQVGFEWAYGSTLPESSAVLHWSVGYCLDTLTDHPDIDIDMTASASVSYDLTDLCNTVVPTYPSWSEVCETSSGAEYTVEHMLSSSDFGVTSAMLVDSSSVSEYGTHATVLDVSSVVDLSSATTEAEAQALVDDDSKSRVQGYFSAYLEKYKDPVPSIQCEMVDFYGITEEAGGSFPFTQFKLYDKWNVYIRDASGEDAESFGLCEIVGLTLHPLQPLTSTVTFGRTQPTIARLVAATAKAAAVASSAASTASSKATTAYTVAGSCPSFSWNSSLYQLTITARGAS